MKYFEAYRFYFDSPKWWLNLLLGAVCMVVPIAGPMVLMGWACGVLERSPRQWGPGSEFDVNKLGNYIGRGVWPLVVQVVVALPVGMIFGMLWFAVVLGTIISAAPQAGPPRFLFFVMPLNFMFVVVLVVLVQMISVPLCLRAAITQDFASAFNVNWVIDFIKRTWAEMLLSMLFFLVTSPFVALAGLLLCCVGYLPALALVSLAHYHIWFQLYDLYLARGGESIPMKAQPASDTQYYAKEN